MRSSAFVAYVLTGVGVASAAGPKPPTFFARHDYAGLYSTQAAVADTNGDGIPDLIADQGGYIEVLFGNGDGTFQRGVFYEMGINARTGNPVVGDFNGYGILDIAVAGPSGVWLFTGKGGRIFNPGVVVAPLPSISGALAATDFNGDHNLDLVVTLPFGGTDGSGDGFVVILGNGNGTFRRPQAFAEPKNTEALAVGSLDKDGPPSIAVCDGAYNAVLPPQFRGPALPS
jgi:hypothetical protein